jgi:stage II sporulation SpoE-like protein
VFRERAGLGPTETVRAAHDALKGTRGAALGIARIDPYRQEAKFVGVGNIAAVLVGSGSDGNRTSMVSHNGTVGHTVRKVQEFTYPWTQDTLLIMHSDGMATQWQVDRYPDLATRHPGLVAGMLFHDFKRGRDDVTIVVVQLLAESRQ